VTLAAKVVTTVVRRILCMKMCYSKSARKVIFKPKPSTQQANHRLLTKPIHPPVPNEARPFAPSDPIDPIDPVNPITRMTIR
jgi:hypothetical protein